MNFILIHSVEKKIKTRKKENGLEEKIKLNFDSPCLHFDSFLLAVFLVLFVIFRRKVINKKIKTSKVGGWW